jgi:hypothetical protein
MCPDAPSATDCADVVRPKTLPGGAICENFGTILRSAQSAISHGGRGWRPLTLGNHHGPATLAAGGQIPVPVSAHRLVPQVPVIGLRVGGRFSAVDQ